MCSKDYVVNFGTNLLRTTVLLAGVALWAGSAAAAPLPVSVPAGEPFSSRAIDRPLADETDAAELAPSVLPNRSAVATIADPVVLAAPRGHDTRSSNIY